MSKSANNRSNSNDAADERRAEPRPNVVLDRQFGIWSAVSLGVMSGCAWPLFAGAIVSVMFLCGILLEANSEGKVISLYNGGPPGVLYELVAISIVYLAVSASIAELASAMPSSAGVYYWAGVLGGPKYGRVIAFFAGWYNCCAWIFSTIATSSVSATQLVSMYSLFHPDYHFRRWHVLIAYFLCSWICAAVVVFRHHQLPRLNSIGLFWILAGVFVTVIVCAIMPSQTGNGYASNHFVWSDWDNKTGYSSNGFVFVLGMLNGAFALGVPDCVSHISEEVSNPSRMVPLAIFAQVTTGFLSTFFYLIAIFYATSDLSAVATSSSLFPIAELYHQATGSVAGTFGLQLLIFLPSFWSIIGAYVTAGRTLWAMGRGNAAPCSSWLAQISARFHSPLKSTLTVMVINSCCGIIYLGSTTAFNAFVGSVICLISISYVICIIPHLCSRRSRMVPGWFFMRGLFGTAVHSVTCAYVVVFVVIFCFPYSMPVTIGSMNYTSAILGGISLAIGFLWFWKRNNGYTGCAAFVDVEHGIEKVNDADAKGGFAEKELLGGPLV